jgi:Abnormal spindle-like microcephaly-assoc'd, ASPM-SPD-2-Hydin
MGFLGFGLRSRVHNIADGADVPRAKSRLGLRRALALAFVLVAFGPQIARGGETLAIATTPGSSEFGNVVVGTKNTQTIQLKNTGLRSLVLLKATISGKGFQLSGLELPFQLIPGTTKAFTVAFEPTVTGEAQGAVLILGLGATLEIPVSGVGVAPVRKLTVSHTHINFGDQTVGATDTAVLTLTNTGNASLKVSEVSVSGAEFSVTHGLQGATLAAGQSATLHATFTPRSTGSASGRVTIVSNASDSPVSVVMLGVGVAKAVQVQHHAVSLSWNASETPGITGYYVYRSTRPSGGYVRLNLLPATATKFADESVVGAETYYYAVTAVSHTGLESALSEEVEARVP